MHYLEPFKEYKKINYLINSDKTLPMLKGPGEGNCDRIIIGPFDQGLLRGGG